MQPGTDLQKVTNRQKRSPVGTVVQPGTGLQEATDRQISKPVGTVVQSGTGLQEVTSLAHPTVRSWMREDLGKVMHFYGQSCYQ